MDDNPYETPMSPTVRDLDKGVTLAQHLRETREAHCDRSVIEVIVAGRQVVAVRVFPSREDSDGVSVLSVGADSVLQSFDAWQMEDIYR